MKSNSGGGDPFTRLILVLVMLGLLCGEYLIIDAIKSAWLRLRLHHVDRCRAAVVLALLRSDPRGLDPTTLLRQGESVLQLRQMLALLITTEWIDISADGRHINLLSPAKRALRN